MKNNDISENATTIAFNGKGCKNISVGDEISGFNDENAGVKGSKEKTPMCLVNDLARFNKIAFQYRLTGEKGPAHCKQFTVTLELGDEVYTAEGLKIKKAQHLAAKDAIERTRYKHPVPKVNRRIEDQSGNSRPNVTPTVELNALAMKLGQQTFYMFDPHQMGPSETKAAPRFEPLLQPPYRAGPPLRSNGHIRSMILEQRFVQTTHNFNGAYVPNLPTTNQAFMRVNQGNHYRPKYQHCYQAESTVQPFIPHPPAPCRITLLVGTNKFYGVGRTIQQAKHDAASQAIVKLKEQMACEDSETVVEKQDDSDHKSPISLVFEIGIKRNLPVGFKILREDGPAHMRKFITACIVGDIMTEGEGAGKKTSKKKAAQKMIEELNKLPPVSPVNVPAAKRTKPKMQSRKTPTTSPFKNKNVEQSQKHNREKTSKSEKEKDNDNPIVKMKEWCKEHNYSEPVFQTLLEKGKERSRRGQFVVEVAANDCIIQGCGPSKKAAKHNAAHNFLLSVSAKNEELISAKEELCPKRVRFPEVEYQLLDGHNLAKVHAEENDMTASTITSGQTIGKSKLITDDVSTVAPQTTKIEATEKSGTKIRSPVENTVKTNAKSKSLHMKDKLIYLAKLIGFDVDFSDYPKGNHNEFLTILMISTNPPQICHGVGINAEESQEDASKNALKILSEMGLNSTIK